MFLHAEQDVNWAWQSCSGLKNVKIAEKNVKKSGKISLYKPVPGQLPVAGEICVSARRSLPEAVGDIAQEKLLDVHFPHPSAKSGWPV